MDTWVVAIATVALVLVTAFYAVRTSSLVAETRNLVAETRASRRPQLVATIDLMPPELGELQLVNAGATPALNISARFWAEPGGAVRTWASPALTTGESVNFDLLPDQATMMTQFGEKHTDIRVEATYHDDRGDIHQLSAALPVASMWEATKAAGQLAAARRYEDRHIEALREIARSLRKL